MFKQKPEKKKANLLARFITWCFVAFGIVVAMLVIATAVIYPQLPSMDDLKNYQPKLPLQVYSEDGVLLGEFGQEHRIFIQGEQIPQMLKDAIVSAEDERFYTHGGIDPVGILRAAVGNIMAGGIQSGGSTITQQVAKNFFLSSKRTFGRKFNEILLSYKIEKSLTKDEIITLYINQIYLGQRAYGFAEAAQTYFAKPIDKLSPAEFAMLAGLPKAPSLYNPVVNPKRAKLRQLYVLGRMNTHGYITDEQYAAAKDEQLVVVKGTAKDATNSGAYVAEMVRQYLYPTYGDAVYTQGFKVYTTINSKMQDAAYNSLRNGLLNYDASTGYHGAEAQIVDFQAPTDLANIDASVIGNFDNYIDYGELAAAIVLQVNNKEITVLMRNGNVVKLDGKNMSFIKNYLTKGGDKQVKVGSVVRLRPLKNGWQLSQIPEVQGGLVAVNPNDGSIKALMGGFDFTINSFNHVLQAKRQPGSGFKPFIYSAALDHGYTPETMVDDTAQCFSGGGVGGDWCPKDDDGNFMGTMSVRQGLTLSRNLVTIKVLNDITPQYAISYIAKFGFDTTQFQPYLTLALGAQEATPMQMAQAYSVFANGGKLVQPYFITKVTDAKDNVIANTANAGTGNATQVIDPRNAFIMNSMLQDVARYGTGARSNALGRSDIAGKTGTTNDSKDVWFNGYTPDLVAITWVGYDQPRSLGRQYGASLALPIWVDFMRVALSGKPVRNLAMPAGIVAVPNGTWKNTTEYYYSENVGKRVDASGIMDASAPVATVSSDDAVDNKVATPSKAKPSKNSNEVENIIDNI